MPDGTANSLPVSQSSASAARTVAAGGARAAGAGQAWRAVVRPAYRVTMSRNHPDENADPSSHDRTPYLERDSQKASDDVAVVDDLEPGLSPAEEVRLRRDLELELERYEQGIEG